MTKATVRTWPSVLLLGGVALAAAACGSSTTSTSATTGGSTSGMSAGVVSAVSVDGTKTLAASDGHTLYSPTNEANGQIHCVGACTSFWKPLTATQQQAQQASSTLHQQFGVVKRPDGGTQLTVAGHPLYTFTPEGAHELQGNNVTDSFSGTQFTWMAALTHGASSGSTSGSGGSTSGGSGGGYSY